MEVVNTIYQHATTADNSGPRNAVQDFAITSDQGAYSSVYQHHNHPQQQSEAMDEGSTDYQKLGMGDYMHMYSKPSPLLVGNESRENASSADKGEDHPQQSSEDEENTDYQKLGMGDYIHMYSKPSPLLEADGSRENAPSAEERESEHDKPTVLQSVC